MSFLTDLARLRTLECIPASMMRLMVSDSIWEDTAKPASM